MLTAFTATAAAAGKPNFIVIVADDLGYGDLSCYGSDSIRTPRLDRMAEEGVRFTDFHSNGTLCSPTRAALMTGQYQQRSGVNGVINAKSGRKQGMSLASTTLPEVLKKADYRTGLVGKWHLGYALKFNPRNRGFDEFVGWTSGNVDYFSHIDQGGYEDWWRDRQKTPEEGYATNLITDHSVRFLQQNKDHPFFLMVAHGAPHYPYQTPDGKAFRRPGDKRAQVPGQSEAEKQRAYTQMVEHLDRSVGTLIDTVEQLGIDDNTLIVFLSDNGPIPNIGSTGGLRGAKKSVYEGGHRVPGVARWPGKIAPHTVSDELVVGMDLFPTLARLAGIEVSGTDGVDLAPVLFEKRPLASRTVYWKYSRQALRKGEWKLVDDELYNLADDPAETHEVADQPERKRELQKIMSAYNADIDKQVEVTARLLPAANDAAN